MKKGEHLKCRLSRDSKEKENPNNGRRMQRERKIGRIKGNSFENLGRVAERRKILRDSVV